jgi:hypothetical protein
VYEVLKAAGFFIDEDEVARKRTYLSDLKRDQRSKLLAENDYRMAGAAGALVDSGQATYVPEWGDLKPGDVMQYWRWRENRDTHRVELMGHVVIVESKMQMEPSMCMGRTKQLTESEDYQAFVWTATRRRI